MKKKKIEKLKNTIVVGFALVVFVLSIIFAIKLGAHPIMAVFLGLFDGAIALFAAVTFLFSEEDVKAWEEEAKKEEGIEK
jgi:glycopeptide antibiotics resistance protein